MCGIDCLEPARRRRAFDRAWRTSVPPAAIDRLRDEMADPADPRDLTD